MTELAPILSLPDLKRLDLAECLGLRSFGRLVELLSRLEHLSLYGCRFDDLPEEICGEFDYDNVLDKVRAHFADLERGQVEDAEVKLFVLGNGGIGKTQMCRRLCGLPYDDKIPTTHGVQLGHFPLTLAGWRSAVQVRFWDFGGQDVYHGTHALFLQGHAIFVILWTPGHEDGETEEGGVPIRNRPLAYWLDYIRALAGTDSPVLLVQSQCDDPGRRCLPPRVATEDFRFLKCLEFSAKTDLGLDVLAANIKEGVRNLLVARPLRKIGAGRVEVRDKLRTMLEKDQTRPPGKRRNRRLTQQKYRDLCQDTGKVSDPDALLDYLHRCGVVFYRRGLFEDCIILDQAWALEAIYTLLHRQRTLPFLARNGRFTRQLLGHLVWQDYSVAEQETFLGMMQSCGICFRARDLSKDPHQQEWEYVAPDLLPEWSGVQDQLFGRLQDAAPTAGATVHFPFLHEGILRTFLSRIGKQARDCAVYWKYGCWFGEEKTRSTILIQSSRGTSIERPGAGEVILSAWGSGAAELVEHVLKTLLDVPAGQAPQVKRTAARQERPMPGPDRSAGVEGLVISSSAHPPGSATKVFISYAWGDSTPQGRERQQIVERLCEQLRGCGCQVIRDKDEMRWGDSISDFMKTIGQGDRVVVILSEKYLRSVYCMTELHAVFDHSRGEKQDFLRRVIPLTLADARISGIRDRAEHARHWKNEKESLQSYVSEGLLGGNDYKQWLKMSRWVSEVSDMLAHIADVLHPVGFEQIVAGDFAAVKERLQRED